MSQVPMMSAVTDGLEHGRGTPMSENIQKRYPQTPMFSQFDGAEIVAQRFNITREAMDNFALISQQRAAAATAAGHFKREILPIEGRDPKTKEKIVHDTDEGNLMLVCLFVFLLFLLSLYRGCCCCC